MTYPMIITVTLNGKDLSFTKGKGGVTKLFTTDLGEVVVVTDKGVTKFGNCPFVCEYESKDKDIEA